MRFFRLLLLSAGGLAMVVGAAVAVVFTTTFQTWVARKALAAQRDLHVSFGAVSAGLQRVTLRDLHIEHAGATLTVPALEIDLPVFAAGFDRKFDVTRMLSRGWTLDLSKAPAIPAGAATAQPAPAAAPPSAGSSATALPEAARTATLAFAGVLAQLSLPYEISLDGVVLEGEVVLPELRGRVKVSVTGGGFGAGREGKFQLVADASLLDPRVNAVGLHATAAGAMDSHRSFSRLALDFETTASGAQFPAGVGLAGKMSATRVASGESYSATVVTQGREILQLSADFPQNASRLSGTWQVNMRAADVAPFTLGLPLPDFTATGQGGIDCDTAFAALHASGRLAATAARLDVLRPELAALGELRIDADFDLAERGGVFEVHRLVATVAAQQPVATVRTLQPFEFNPATAELRATDPAHDLVGISLLGLPVAWAKPFLDQVDVSGDALRGELVGMSRGGGLALRSAAPISIGGLSVARGAVRLVENLDVVFATMIDYNPKGWHTEIENLSVRCRGVTVLTLDAKAGRLAGTAEPLKTTGKLTAHLPAVLAQSVATGVLALTGGEAVVDFAASLGSIKELQARIDFRNLESLMESKPTKLPAFSADLRADLSADGRIAFSVPLAIEANGRKSDLHFTGSFVPGKPGSGTLVASVTSSQLFVEDVRAFATVIPETKSEGAPGAGIGAPVPGARPPWADLDGSVTLQLRQVVYSDAFRASNVSGRLGLESGKIKLESGQAGLGDNGRANINGVLTFDAAQPQPYALVGEVAIKEFDPVPLFQALNHGQPSTVEGRFDISSKLSSRAASVHELALGAGGEFHLTSKGGIFRGLQASVTSAAGSNGRVAGLLSAASKTFGGLTSKKEYTAVSSKTQAVSEFASGLNPITFDQLSVVLARDAALNTTLKDFALIAPEVRLTGSGTLLHKPDSPLLADSLAMEFKLRARGRQGELLKYLGALDSLSDDLGYSACTLPIRVGGTMGKPDTSELSARLAALALEKTGVTEKATELFNKLIGGGK
jgi:hypothetical protein